LEQTNLFDFGVEDTHDDYLSKYYDYKKVFPKGHIAIVVETFAGIGCQVMGFERANIPCEVIGISEIDKYALLSYESMHGTTHNFGGIGSFERLPKGIDVCTWSFPCTDISLAGKQKGMEDGTRSNYGYVFLETVENTPLDERPKVLIMENVKALTSDTFRRDWDEIYNRLLKMGYKNYSQVLNAKDYGVAQNRERVFIISILGGGEYKFPPKEILTKRLKDYLEDEVDESYYLSDKMLSCLKGENRDVGKYDIESAFRPLKEESPYGWTITTRPGSRPTDNFILEPIKIEKVNESYSILHGGKWDKMHDIGRRVYETTTVCPTIHTMGGGNLEPKIIEDFYKSREPREYENISPTIRAERSGLMVVEENKSTIAIPEATQKGYALAEDGDGVYIDRPHQKRGVVQKGMIQTLKANGNDVGVVVQHKNVIDSLDTFYDENGYLPEFFNPYNNSEIKDVAPTVTTMADRLQSSATCLYNNNLRIRKLTARECWRLMGIDDKYYDRASKVVSKSQLYKQAGNGIVVDVMAKILIGLFET